MGGASKLFAEGERRQRSARQRLWQCSGGNIRAHTRDAHASLGSGPLWRHSSSSRDARGVDQQRGAAGSNTLTVKAGEYTYVLKGSPKAGWTEIDFENAGVEDHMMAMFKLKKGVTDAAAEDGACSSQRRRGVREDRVAGGDPTVSGTPSAPRPGAEDHDDRPKLAGRHYGIVVLRPRARRQAPTSRTAWYKVFDGVKGKSSVQAADRRRAPR